MNLVINTRTPTATTTGEMVNTASSSMDIAQYQTEYFKKQSMDGMLILRAVMQPEIGNCIYLPEV